MESPKSVGWAAVPFRPSTDWIRPTHFMEGNLLYSKSIKKKTFTEISRIMSDQISGHHGSGKLIHKINVTATKD